MTINYNISAKAILSWIFQPIVPIPPSRTTL